MYKIKIKKRVKMVIHLKKKLMNEKLKNDKNENETFSRAI